MKIHVKEKKAAKFRKLYVNKPNTKIKDSGFITGITYMGQAHICVEPLTDTLVVFKGKSVFTINIS